MVAVSEIEAEGLFVAGVAEGGRLVLLAPREPGFWAHLTAQPGWGVSDDPVDDWSRRVIGALAKRLGGEALFPFGGPPYAPFFHWALESGRAWSSPVTLLVQAEMGLFASYRGAIRLPEPVAMPEADKPCDTCAAPCLIACPVGALTGAGYDLPRCHAFLDTPEGADCMTRGCAVRRACPVSQSYGRVEAQSAYHMRRFHR